VSARRISHTDNSFEMQHPPPTALFVKNRISYTVMSTFLIICVFLILRMVGPTGFFHDSVISVVLVIFLVKLNLHFFLRVRMEIRFSSMPVELMYYYFTLSSDYRTVDQCSKKLNSQASFSGR